VGGNTD